MVQEQHDTVVCAVGDDGSPAAVTVAAIEAARLGAGLHLVHATPWLGAAVSDEVLDGAVARARAGHPGLRVDREAVEGSWIATGLAGAERGARYVVVERSQRGRVSHVLSGSTTGSTTGGVVLGVTAPVLCVPHGWTEDGSGPAVVAVAVQDADEVPTLVALAAGEAEARGADLLVVHAVDPACGHDGVELTARHDWVERAHRELDGPVRAVSDRHPGLKVRLDVVFDGAADALVATTASSALLVAGRRHHEHAWGTHLGPVVRRLLLDAACPVLLPPDPERATGAARRPVRRPAAVEGPVPDDVVVALGEDDARASIRFAVAEAARRGVGVHLVHVVRMPAVDGVSTAEVWRDALAHGRAVIDRADQLARTTGGPHLRVTHQLCERGGLVPDLVATAEHAGLVVVQHRHLGRGRRLVTWSVTNGLAARTDVPVVAVPSTWTPDPSDVGFVVVGVQDLDDATHLVAVALAEASRRALPLRVIHAGRPTTAERDALKASVDDVARSCPGVRVYVSIGDRDPVDLLVGAMSAAALVVVGRRRHSHARRSHLGPVARNVLDASSYPVMLAPPAPR